MRTPDPGQTDASDFANMSKKKMDVEGKGVPSRFWSTALRCERVGQRLRTSCVNTIHPTPFPMYWGHLSALPVTYSIFHPTILYQSRIRRSSTNLPRYGMAQCSGPHSLRFSSLEYKKITAPHCRFPPSFSFVFSASSILTKVGFT